MEIAVYNYAFLIQWKRTKQSQIIGISKNNVYYKIYLLS